MPRRSYAHVVADWERTLGAIDVRQTDLEHLGVLRPQLAAALEELKKSIAQQSERLTQYRLATRSVEELLKVGQDLSDRLRNGIRMKFGRRAEELLEFGLQPLRPQVRSKSKKKKPDPTVQSDPAPEASNQT